MQRTGCKSFWPKPGVSTQAESPCSAHDGLSLARQPGLELEEVQKKGLQKFRVTFESRLVVFIVGCY